MLRRRCVGQLPRGRLHPPDSPSRPPRVQLVYLWFQFSVVCNKSFFFFLLGLYLGWCIEGRLVADFAFYFGFGGGSGVTEAAARSADMPLDLIISLLEAAAFSSDPGIVRSGQSSRVRLIDSFGGLANIGLLMVCMVLTGCVFVACSRAEV